MKKLFLFGVLCALAFLAAPAPYSVAAIDMVAPTVGTPTPTSATFGVPVTFSVTYSDEVGVTNCTLSFSEASPSTNVMTLGSSAVSGTATFTVTPDDSGTGFAYAVCTDAAANVQVGETVEVFVATADVVAPTVGAASPLVATTGVATTISATYSDAVGVASCDLYIAGASVGAMTLGSSSTSGTATYAYTASASGSVSVQAKCTDATGNVGSGSSRTLVVSSDSTAPAVGAVTPTTATQNTALTLSATYSDNIAVTACTLYVGGVSQGAMTLASGTASASYTFTMSGTSSVRATCVDAAGNTGSGSATTVTIAAATSTTTTTTTTTTTVETVAPTVGAITPITATQDTAVTFSATVTDASGIQDCRLFVNGSDQGAMTASGSLYSKSYTPASSGTLTAYASCGDTVGNLADGTSVTVTVAAAAATSTDAVAPTVGAISPTTAVAGTSLTLTASVADSGGMGSCVVYVNGTNLGTMTISGSYATYAYTFSTQGTAVANAYCVDAVGNATQGASSSITISAAASTTPTEEELSAVSEAAVGSLIKLACDADADVNDPCKAVYYYDNMRHAFPNEKVFFTWYENFDNVIIVTADFMASVTLSRNVTYHPGTRMVKFITVNTVYGVGTSGELRAIASEDVAASIWGSNWNTLIDDISDAFYGNYTFGANIDSTSDFDPTVVKESVESILEIFAE